MTQYLVFAGNKEPYLAERDVRHMDSANTFRSLVSGEWQNVNKIIALSDDGLWIDVTDVFARKAMEYWAHEGEPLTRWQREFIELHVSVPAANSFAQAAE